MPDRVSLQLAVDGNGPSREEAYAAAARLTAAVDAVLAAEKDAFDRVTSAALIVQPSTRWKKGETIRTGWRASRSSIVEIRSLERAGELLAQLTAAGGAVSGLSWELDPGHPALDEARRRAGEDARRRAEQYATALGVGLGAVAWIAEPGLRGPGHVGGGGVMRAAASKAAPAGGEEAIDVAPEELSVTAAVEVGFEIAAG